MGGNEQALVQTPSPPQQGGYGSSPPSPPQQQQGGYGSSPPSPPPPQQGGDGSSPPSPPQQRKVMVVLVPHLRRSSNRKDCLSRVLMLMVNLNPLATQKLAKHATKRSMRF